MLIISLHLIPKLLLPADQRITNSKPPIFLFPWRPHHIALQIVLSWRSQRFKSCSLHWRLPKKFSEFSSVPLNLKADLGISFLVPPVLTSFISDHKTQRVVGGLIWVSSSQLHLQSAYLHLTNIWPPSSSSLWHMGVGEPKGVQLQSSTLNFLVQG